MKHVKITETNMEFKMMEENKIIIATLNLCLGLSNKKLEVENLMTSNKIDILCLQETEVLHSVSVDSL